MNKLREKFLKILSCFHKTEKCEQITDDFSVKFLEWKEENVDFFHGENQYHFDNKWYTTTELLQIFKEKYYE